MSEAAKAKIRGFAPIERSPTVADEVADRIIMAIAEGGKQPGDRITEAEIAAAMNVSRVPAREAMQKLEQQGILVPAELRGMRIADFSEARIRELYELRIEIEKIIFRHALPRCRAHPELVVELDAIVDRMEAASHQGDVVATSLSDIDFHRTVARISQNALAARVWEGLSQHMVIVLCREWSRAPDKPGEIELHRDLCGFLRTGSIEDIDAILGSHILNAQSLLTRTWETKT